MLKACGEMETLVRCWLGLEIDITPAENSWAVGAKAERTHTSAPPVPAEMWASACLSAQEYLEQHCSFRGGFCAFSFNLRKNVINNEIKDMKK